MVQRVTRSLAINNSNREGHRNHEPTHRCGEIHSHEVKTRPGYDFCGDCSRLILRPLQSGGVMEIVIELAWNLLGILVSPIGTIVSPLGVIVSPSVRQINIS